MKPKVHTRRQYLINKQLQLSYAWLLIICVGIVMIIFGLSLWYVSKVHLNLFHSIVGEDALPQSYISSIQNQFLLGTLIAVAVVSCLLLLLGIYASHKIAGPAYRITKSLNLVGVEDEMDTIQIRKRDQLKEMADAFNHMVHALKDRMYQDMRLIDQVRAKIVQLHESLRGESIDIKKLSDQVREIDKLATELRSRKYV